MNIDTATKEELKAYARDELGLPLSLTMNEDTMRQRIRDFLMENDTQSPQIVLGSRNVAQKDVASKSKTNWIEIEIQKTSEKGGGEAVPVNYNGKLYTIPRGRPIKVPPPVEHILSNAIRTIYEEPEEIGQPMIQRNVLAYPYMIISGHEYRLPTRSAA